MSGALPLIGVIDLRSGHAVHAIAGQRHRYREVVAADVESGNAVELAKRYRRLGIDALYVADLDAIEGQGDHRDLIATLSQLAPSLLIDAGPASNQLAGSLSGPNAQFVLPTESFATVDDWTLACEQVGVYRAVMGLDLSGTRLRVGSGPGDDNTQSESLIKNISPWINRAEDMGVRSLVVLDLAFVGMSQGTGTEDRCKQIAARWPKLKLISGGGIRDAGDVQSLLAAGCDQVLVATALHDDAATQKLFGPVS